MPTENRFDSRQPVIDLDHFPDESLETGFEAVKSCVHAAFKGCESALHACKPSANGIHLQNSGHDNREHRHNDSKVKLNVGHAWLQYKAGIACDPTCLETLQGSPSVYRAGHLSPKSLY